MEEGTKNAELIFRASLALKEITLKMAIALLQAYLGHLRWLREHNMKTFGRKIIDRLEIGTTKTLSTLIEKRKGICKKFIESKNKEIDIFKLNKQYELEKYKAEVSKAQKVLDLAIESKSTEDIAIKQTLLYQALENKKNFEYKTNQELMAKNHELDDYKNELSQLEYDIKVCNAELNALYSDKNIGTGRVKMEYNNLKDKYSSQDIALDQEDVLHNTGSFDEMAQNLNENEPNQEQYHMDNVEKVVEVDIAAQMLAKDPEALEIFNKMIKAKEVSEKQLDKPINKNVNTNIKDDKGIDIVEQMLNKDPKALKTYQDSKARGDFKMNVSQLSKGKSIDI